MGKRSTNPALREIRTVYSLGALGALSDAELLALFLTRRGADADDAFAALVDRHGSTVLGACRRVLGGSSDADDAFQATFIVLARRAGSIARRERLASWLYGVAVRTAKEAKRRASRQRVRETRMINVSEADDDPTPDEADLLKLLDEELSHLPERYRAALVACELEGKSRRDAARELGLPEGTLSTYLARGRKRLRERLLRRGAAPSAVTGMAATWSVSADAVPVSLARSAVDSALAYAGRGSLAAPVTGSVTALAERVLAMMFLKRLGLFVAVLAAAGSVLVAAATLGSTELASDPAQARDENPGPHDFIGRVIDKTGAGVADVQVWMIGGGHANPTTVGTSTTDTRGRFILRDVLDRPAAKIRSGAGRVSVFARARDGRTGWLAWALGNNAVGKVTEIELGPVGEARGRVIDQDGRAIANATLTPVLMSPPGADPSDYVHLSQEVGTPIRATTRRDGSFVLTSIPHGAGLQVVVDAKGFGAVRMSWESAQAVSITLHGRLGTIRGRLKAAKSPGLGPRLSLHVYRTQPADGRGAFQILNQFVEVGKDGTFRVDGLPPGRYAFDVFRTQGNLVARDAVECNVTADSVTDVDVPFEPFVTITGRVTDAQSGKGIKGVGIVSYRLEDRMYLQQTAVTQTDADGRYSVQAQAGTATIHAEGLPRAYYGPVDDEFPTRDVNADQVWPDLKLARGADVDGIVVDESGQPVEDAQVYMLAVEPPGSRRRNEPVRTGRDGRFHFEQLDPNDRLSIWAGTKLATTDGAIVVRPKEIKEKLKVTIAAKSTFRIRGKVADASGKPIAGAKVTLWCYRPYTTDKARMQFA
jgi:RNA polymerase sigma factor (sigma-70 family)